MNFTSISKKNIILMEREFSDIIYNNVDEPALPPRHRYTHTEEYQSPAPDHSHTAKACQKEESQELQVRTHKTVHFRTCYYSLASVGQSISQQQDGGL